jgi:hypothetical protein
MTISAISPSTSASPISNFQTFRQDFSQLTSALQSGDLSSAQSAYTTLSSSPLAQGNNPFAHAADPDSDGDSTNNDTVINIQITVSSGSDNKVDIQV